MLVKIILDEAICIKKKTIGRGLQIEVSW